MSGIVKSWVFDIDTAGIKKMAQEAEWLGGDKLHEMSVSENGAVRINARVVFEPEQARAVREAELKRLHETLERLKTNGAIRISVLKRKTDRR